jgi:hypothetical protein
MLTAKPEEPRLQLPNDAELNKMGFPRSVAALCRHDRGFAKGHPAQVVSDER